MIETKGWAFRRQAIIVFFLLVIGSLVSSYVYFTYLTTPPTCFDEVMNGDELGVDCGGACTRICSFSVIPPEVKWAKAFRILEGQYNVVAYIENKNRVAATSDLGYTITLSDAAGVITVLEGSTVLPPDNVYPVFEGRVLTGDREPTDITVTLSQPDVWLPVMNAREQFTLIDRGEVQNADAAPRLESSLRNNGLTVVDDVEVVTTIYDISGNPLTASRTFVDVMPDAISEIIFTWPEPIATTLRSCEIPTDVLLAIDLSGSMNNLGGVPPEPLASVKRAAESFVSRMGQKDRVGVVTFATDGELVSQLAPNPPVTANNISRLEIAPEEETGSTNSGAAMLLAQNEFSSARHNPDARKVLVLLTDGLTNEPDPEPEAYALAQAQSLKDSDVTIYTIGLGDEVNTEFLINMASSPENFYRSIDPSAVDSLYRNITESICEDGAARIDVIPKSDVNFPQWP